MKTDWKKSRLEELCYIQIGKTPRREVAEYWGKGYTWVSISDLKGRVILDSKEEITENAVKSTGCKIIPKGTILLSFKLSIGKVAFAGKDLFTNEAIAALPIKNRKKLHPDYLYYALRVIPINGSNNAAKGVTLNKESLKNIEIPVPDTLSDQLRIAALLTRAEGLIAQRKESLRLLDELVKGAFLEMFGDPVRNEKGWDLVELHTKCKKIGSGATPRGGKESYVSQGISLIRSMNVHNNQFKYAELAFISDAQAHDLRNVVVEENDVLLNITGASVARCCLAPKEILPARVNQHVSIIRTDSRVLHPTYLNRLFTSETYQRQLIKKARAKGATREAITKEEIEMFEIPLPSPHLQTQFATLVERVEVLKKHYTDSLREMEQLYGSLSRRAFRGELDLRGVVVEKELEQSDESSAEDRIFEMAERVRAMYHPFKELQKFGKAFREGIAPMQQAMASYTELLGKVAQEVERAYSTPIAMPHLDFSQWIPTVDFRRPFTFEELWQQEMESKEYEEMKRMLFDWVKGDNPFVDQFFDETDQQIKFRLRETPSA